MTKETWKAGNMIYPLPAVMVSAADKEGNQNIITIAWTGTVCTNPAMLYISVRPERYTYHMIKETGEFVVNLTTKDLVYATDWCGVKSGRDVDKWKEMKLTPEKEEKLGSHHMFLAEVQAVQVDQAYMTETGKFELNKTGLVAYSHGTYLETGKPIGTFGYSVHKNKKNTKNKKKKK